MVHMIRCDDCSDADWASTWASYFFATVEPDGRTIIAPPMLAVPPAYRRRTWIFVGVIGIILLLRGAKFLRRPSIHGVR